MKQEQPRVTPELVTEAVQQAAFSGDAVTENANPGTFKWSLGDFIPLVQRGERRVGGKIHREKLNEPEIKNGPNVENIHALFQKGSTPRRHNS